MDLSSATKRLFFGASIEASWPHELPEGRVVEESERHLTLAFLGNISLQSLEALLPSIPLPSFQIGAVGKSDKFIFLPERSPHVVAAEVHWMEHVQEIEAWQKKLSLWLKGQGYPIDTRPFFSHITVARTPFDPEEWKKISLEIPLVLTGFHLYESVGNLKYKPLWSHALVLPFEELEHTADIAFYIRGETKREIHLHAQMALAFKFPRLLPYLAEPQEISLDEIIISLNAMIGRADREIGVPFKAVSFHGTLKNTKLSILEWEMIVDV